LHLRVLDDNSRAVATSGTLGAGRERGHYLRIASTHRPGSRGANADRARPCFERA
jgi:hypothetical protein